MIVPDFVAETFRPTTSHEGRDEGDRGVRYLEWTWDADPDDTEVNYEFILALKEGDELRAVVDRQIVGLFPRATWLGSMEDAGFEAEVVEDPSTEGERVEIFVGHRPPCTHQVEGCHLNQVSRHAPLAMPILYPAKTAISGGREYMAGGNLLRLGGVSGLLAVFAMIPAYLVGYPDAPGSPLEAQSYFEGGPDSFVLSNGIFPLFHVFFFILFLGVLYGMLRSAGDEAGGMGAALSGAALAGGIVFVTLSAAGFTAEILYPAVLQRFGRYPTGRGFCARFAHPLLVAVPLLSDRDVDHGAQHLTGSRGNGCLARMASPGRLVVGS